MSAPMRAEPATAPWMKGKPCTAMAVSDVSDTAWEATATSVTTRTSVSHARARVARAASISAHRTGGQARGQPRGQDRPDPGAEPGGGGDREVAADRLD